jgi:hypothetical protein
LIVASVSRAVAARARGAAALAAALALGACAEYLGTSFSEIAPPEIAGRAATPGAHCSIESVNGAPPGEPWRVSRTHRVEFHGWAIDAATLTTSDWLVVALAKEGGGKRYFAVTWARGPREDVAREFGAAAGAVRPGFDLAATLQLVPPGAYDVEIIVGGPSGPVGCATGRKLIAA